MKTAIRLTIVTLLFSIGIDNSQAQMATPGYVDEETGAFKYYTGFQDSKLKQATDSSAASVLHGGFGFGYMMNGGFVGMKCKFVSSVRWGVSLDFKYGASRTKNLPSDYTPLFYPRDYRTVGSIHLVRVLTGHGQNPRISIEVGPSLVRIDNAIITPNPDYDPNSILHLSKYFKSREIESAVGLSMNMETEMLVTSYMIMDISVFANLNKATSFLGVGLYFNFGNVKD